LWRVVGVLDMSMIRDPPVRTKRESTQYACRGE
jgi:hypothetical protein